MPIIGTSPESIDLAEDRERFRLVIERLGLRQPPNASATRYEEARRIAERIGYPVVVRPSFVLGGRAMEIVYDEPEPRPLHDRGRRGQPRAPDPDRQVPGRRHRGRRRCRLRRRADDRRRRDGAHRGGRHPLRRQRLRHPAVLAPGIDRRPSSKQQTYALAQALEVRGLMNIQFAVKDGEIYVLEVNPRASRTVPFVSKATGLNLAQVAARVMVGKSLEEQGITAEPVPKYVSVKEAVFPFAKFPGVDIVLGPEMRSTGEVMGIDTDFASAFAKSQLAATEPVAARGHRLRERGRARPPGRRADRAPALHDGLPPDRNQRDCWHAAPARHRDHHHPQDPRGTPQPARPPGQRHDRPDRQHPQRQGGADRRGPHPRSAVSHGVPCITTIAGARAAVAAMERLREGKLNVYALQDLLGTPPVQPGR